MTIFSVKNSDLINFFEKCAANGVVSITPTDKISRYFFKHFYVDVKEDKLTVKATDSGESRMYIRHFLNGVEVEDEGVIGVTDVELILDILKAIPRKRKIRFNLEEETNYLFVETVDDGTYYGYRIRQEKPTEDIQISLENSKVGVGFWDQIHSFDEKAGVPRISMEEGTALYNTIINFNKSELSKVINDSIKLTYDQDLELTISENKVKFKSGKKADGVVSETILTKKIINPINETKIITNLHPIVDHLFNNITFFCRLAGADNSLKFWIKSEEENIQLNFSSSSV